MLDSATTSPKDDAPLHRVAHRHEDGEGGEGRHADLEGAADGDCPPDESQARERELKPDGEEQQDHADLGDLRDVLGVPDKPEAVWSRHGAGDEEPDGGREANSVQAERGCYGQRADDGQLAEELLFRH